MNLIEKLEEKLFENSTFVEKSIRQRNVFHLNPDTNPVFLQNGSRIQKWNGKLNGSESLYLIS